MGSSSGTLDVTLSDLESRNEGHAVLKPYILPLDVLYLRNSRVRPYYFTIAN